MVIRGHAMLSHEGLPPERETLEYAWQLEIVLGKVSARITTVQVIGLNIFAVLSEVNVDLIRRKN